MKDKNLVSVTKAIAILTVICAHVSLITRGGALGDYSMHVLSNLGTIGVGIFYFIGGYNFRPEKYKFSESIKLKCVSIVIPWICVGTLVWLYIVLRKGGISFVGWLKFIIGYQSYLYFLTNLIIFYLLFYLISRIGDKKTGKIVCIVLILLSFLSIFFESKGMSVFPNFYLDPFIFVGYFSAGYVLRGHENVTDRRLLNSPLWIASFIIPFLPSVLLSYAGDVFVPVYETMFIIGAIALARLLVHTVAKDVLIWMGKQSMAIYLLHMPFAGIIANIFNRFSWCAYIDFLRPFLTLAITAALIRTMVFICQKMNACWLLKIMGIRRV